MIFSFSSFVAGYNPRVCWSISTQLKSAFDNLDIVELEFQLSDTTAYLLFH